MGDASPLPDAARRVTPRDLALLAVVMLVGLGLRLVHLETQPLWLDEATTASFAARGFVESATSEIHHPPLHYVLCHFAHAAVVGPPPPSVEGIPDSVTYAAQASNTVFRWLSVLFGVLLIPALAFLGRHLAPRGRERFVFHAAALLAATSPFLIYLSQEGRDYALYVLLAVLSTQTFLRCVGLSEHHDADSPAAPAPRPRRLLALHGLWSVLLVYTHHLGALVLLAHELLYWILWRRAGRAGGRLPITGRAWFVARVLSGLAFAPWMLWVIHQIVTGAGHLEARHWVGEPSERIPYSFFRFVLGFGIGPENADAAALPRAELMARDGPVILALLLPAIALTLLGLRRRIWRPWRGFTLAVILLFPYALLLPLSPWLKMIHERYLCFQGPLLLLVFAAVLAGVGRRLRLVLGGGLALSTLFALLVYFGVWNQPFGLPWTYEKESWDDAAALVAEHEPDLLVLAPAHIYFSFDRSWLRHGAGEAAQPRRAWWPAGSGGPDGWAKDTIPELAPGERMAIVASRIGEREERMFARYAHLRKVADVWLPAQTGIRVLIFDRP